MTDPTSSPFTWLILSAFLLFECRFEHPAGGYKKIFETCEDLAEPLPATVTGLLAHQRSQMLSGRLCDNWSLICCSLVFLQAGFLHFLREVSSVWVLGCLRLGTNPFTTFLMARPSCTNLTLRTARSPTSEGRSFSSSAPATYFYKFFVWRYFGT